MSKKYFTVGPTELSDGVLNYYKDAVEKNLFSVSHRSAEFEEISSHTVNSLKVLLGIPDDFYVFFLSSATECMERSLQNLVAEKSFHFINGWFAQRYYDIAKALGKKPEYVKSEFGKNFDYDNISIPEGTDLVCMTHNETSTGTVFNIDKIYEIKQSNTNINIAVDAVTSLPFYRFNYSHIDVLFFSVQKGFGLPPGLGVMLCRKSLIEKSRFLSESGFTTGTYNSFIKLAANADKNQTTMTPNIPAIYLLGRVCDDLYNKGLDIIREETEKKANLIYSFFDKHPNIKPFVKESDIRSKTTLVLESNIDTGKIFTKLEYNDFVVSRGYGDYKNKHIRIGNFPMHKFEDVSNLLYLFKKF
ncbi:MAG: aminotransferase class V-fold PLP-dependent enzyme [Candidatus Kapaibacterium sp.]